MTAPIGLFCLSLLVSSVVSAECSFSVFSYAGDQAFSLAYYDTIHQEIESMLVPITSNKPQEISLIQNKFTCSDASYKGEETYRFGLQECPGLFASGSLGGLKPGEEFYQLCVEKGVLATKQSDLEMEVTVLKANTMPFKIYVDDPPESDHVFRFQCRGSELLKPSSFYDKDSCRYNGLKSAWECKGGTFAPFRFIVSEKEPVTCTFWAAKIKGNSEAIGSCDVIWGPGETSPNFVCQQADPGLYKLQGDANKIRLQLRKEEDKV